VTLAAAERLDDAALLETADTANMLRQVASAAAQVRAAARAATDADLGGLALDQARGFPPQQHRGHQLPPARIKALRQADRGTLKRLLARLYEERFGLLQPLVSDLRDRRDGLGIESLDYLVIPGDLTNRGAYEEFERVHDFLSDLVKEMKLTAERTIIVPGWRDRTERPPERLLKALMAACFASAPISIGSESLERAQSMTSPMVFPGRSCTGAATYWACPPSR